MPYLKSVGVGTVVLKNELFSYLDAQPNISFQDAFNKLVEGSKAKLNSLEKFETNNRPIKAFGVGNGITSMTGGKGNKAQHGRVLSVGQINSIADDILYETSTHLSWEVFPGTDSNYPDGIKRRLEYIQHLDRENPKLIEKELSMLFGRIGYQELLNLYGVQEIKVCGAGLRYGVFFAVIFDEFK